MNSNPSRIDRRAALRQLGAIVAAGALPRNFVATAAEPPATTGLGLVSYCCGFRRKRLQQQNPEFDLFEPLTFLKHCRELGAGGMQAALGVLEPSRVRALRDFAESQGLFIDAIVGSPVDESDTVRFEAEIRTAAEAGALAVRTVIMPGRRYEQFQSLAEFQAAAARGQQMLERAAPIVEKHRVRLAVENHKDQRIDERIALYERLSCEFIGACVDTGNSFALLDDPYETVEALAPYAFTVHLKDQAVREYGDGFLLGDIPLGQGCFDLKRMTQTLLCAKPKIRFTLELITRDPLKVPCLTEKYWTTMPNVSGAHLARALQIVRKHPAETLQQVSSQTPEEQLQLEDANIGASLKFAQETLRL